MKPRFLTGVATFVLSTAIAFGGLAGPAAAQSVPDRVLGIVADAAKAAGAKEVTWGKVTGDDTRFTVAGSKTVIEAEGKTSTITADTVTYVGAVPTATGGFSADRIEADGFTVAMDDDSRLAVQHIAIDGYVGQAPAKIADGSTSGETFRRAELSGLTVTTEDGQTVPVGSAVITTEDFLAGIPRRSAFTLTGLVVPLDPADEGTKQLADLGYTRVAIDLSFRSTWDDVSGRIVVDPLTITAADMGSLSLAFTLGGVTPKTVADLEAAKGTPEKQMEILQGLTVEKATLRYVDASLAGRLLAGQAKEQGVDAKTYATQLKLIVPMMLSTIGNKDFEKAVAGAVGTFLDSPKSLTVSAAPKAPLPIAQIMGAAMMAPQSLPTVLGAAVSAND